MLYIFNRTLPDKKKILYTLTHLYGVNIYQSKRICANTGINPLIKTNKLKINYVNRLINYIGKNIKVEQHLKQLKKQQQTNLLDIKTIRGIRRSLGLPVRGQRTHTNSKTCKKFKFKVFSMKKKKRKKK